jgi:hypothetical protein
MSVIINGTDGVQFNDASLQGAAASPFGLKNRIINGDMRIDQRNAGASITPTDGQYTLDRWVAYRTQASKFTVQQNAGSVTPPAGFTNYLGVTSSSSYSVLSTDVFLVTQVIEGYNVADLAYGTASAKTVTLSFWVRSSLTGTFGGALNNINVNKSYTYSYSIPAANTWTYITVTIPGDTASALATTNAGGLTTYFNLGAGSNWQTTAGTWTAGNYSTPSGTVNIVGTNGATFYFTGVQLEQNTSATPFERRLFNQELATCFRYFETMGGGNIHGASYNGATTIGEVQYKARKRTTPTVSGTTGNNISSVVAGVDNFHFTGTQPSYVATALIDAEL